MSENNESSYASWLQTLNNQYLFYLSTVAFPLAFILNSISLVVFSRKRFANHTNGLFNIYIDILNNSLFLIAFPFYYSKGIGNDIELWSDLTCKSLNYLLEVSISCNSWLNVLISFDRMVSVVYPHSFKFMKKRKCIYIIFALILVALCLLYTPNLLLKVITVSVNSTDVNKTSTTTKLCSGSPLLVNIRDGIALSFTIILPFILMLLFNIILIKSIIKMKRNLNIDRSLRKEEKFARSILALNFLFFITSLPYLVALVLLNMFQYSSKSTFSSSDTAIINFCLSIAVSISVYNHGLPCLVNLYFNKVFREEFFNLLSNTKSFLTTTNSIKSSTQNA